MNGLSNRGKQHPLRIALLIVAVACSLPLISCKGSATSVSASGRGGDGDGSGRKHVSGVKFTSPAKNFKAEIGESFVVTFEDIYQVERDSLKILLDGVLLYNSARSIDADGSVAGADGDIADGGSVGGSVGDGVGNAGDASLSSFEVQGLTEVGKHALRVESYYNDGKVGISSFNFTTIPNPPKHYTYELLDILPHDSGAFTQGLLFHDGFLYEGTGRTGRSVLKKSDIGSGMPLMEFCLSKEYFGEGITLADGKIYQLTWKNKTCFVYDVESFTKIGEFPYESEGWGLTTAPDGRLIMSDGTETLYFINPENFGIVETLAVYDDNGAVKELNELEYARGLIWANIWKSDRVVAIDPATGVVVGDLDLSDLLSKEERNSLKDSDYVLNGIAYDPESDTFYLTGKCWSSMFRMKISQ